MDNLCHLGKGFCGAILAGVYSFWATAPRAEKAPPNSALKGNCKVRSDLGFFFESVDLSLMNNLGPQVDSSHLLVKMVKIKRVHVRDFISVKK